MSDLPSTYRGHFLEGYFRTIDGLQPSPGMLYTRETDCRVIGPVAPQHLSDCCLCVGHAGDHVWVFYSSSVRKLTYHRFCPPDRYTPVFMKRVDE